MIVLEGFFIVILAICAYFDIRKGIIPAAFISLAFVPPFILGLWTKSINIFPLLVFAAGLAVRFISKNSIGAGDVALVTALAAVFKHSVAVNTIIGACIGAFVFMLVCNKSKGHVPFVPFILIMLIFSLISG